VPRTCIKCTLFQY